MWRRYKAPVAFARVAWRRTDLIYYALYGRSNYTLRGFVGG